MFTISCSGSCCSSEPSTSRFSIVTKLTALATCATLLSSIALPNNNKGPCGGDIQKTTTTTHICGCGLVAQARQQRQNEQNQSIQRTKESATDPRKRRILGFVI